MSGKQEKSAESYSTARIFGDYLLMLLVPAVVSIYYYGNAALSTLLVCAFTALGCDILGSALITKQFYIKDTSAICSGIMIALMLPATAPLYVGALASAFAVIVIKVPFGGGKHAPFVPAAAGFASAAVCFKEYVFTYSGGRDGMVTRSLGATLLSGGSLRLTSTTVIDILTGNFYGPMGTGCVIIFIACIVFMAIRRKNALITALGFIVSCAVIAVLFPRTNGTRLSSLVLELCSGSLLFTAMFFMTDYATQPKHSINKIMYGLFTGIIFMAMRHFGAYEEPACFAVLLGNAFSSFTDLLAERLQVVFTSKKGTMEVKIDEA